MIDLMKKLADNPPGFGHAPQELSMARLLLCEEYKSWPE